MTTDRKTSCLQVAIITAAVTVAVLLLGHLAIRHFTSSDDEFPPCDAVCVQDRVERNYQADLARAQQQLAKVVSFDFEHVGGLKHNGWLVLQINCKNEYYGNMNCDGTAIVKNIGTTTRDLRLRVNVRKPHDRSSVMPFDLTSDDVAPQETVSVRVVSTAYLIYNEPYHGDEVSFTSFDWVGDTP